MFPHLTSEEVLAALDDVAYEVLGETGVSCPPVNALAVAGRLGMIVARDPRQAGRARLVRLAESDDTSQPVIFLAHEPRREREHFAVAHEIGEHLAHRVYARLGADPCELSSAVREAVANRLAAHLLLPTDWLAVAGLACDWDLLRLKERFSTASHELIARRMLDYSPAVVVTVFDQGARTWRQANLLGRAPRLAALEERAWRVAHESGQACDLSDSWGRVRVWAVHEPEWQREFIRYEPHLSDADEPGEYEAWEGAAESADRLAERATPAR